ncbi:siroheme synthase CysG [Planctomycetota bacterium]
MFLPINLNLTDRQCVVIGGGKVARRKCLKLLDAQAKVKVIAPEFMAALGDWSLAGMTLIKRSYRKSDLEGAWLVIAATDDSKINAQITRDARELGIWVQRVDDPLDCDFSMSATLRHGDFTVSFATGGAIPALSAKLKQQARKQYDPAYSEFCDLARSIRREAVKQNIPPQEREHLHKQLVNSGLVELLIQNDKEQAYAKARDLLASAGRSAQTEDDAKPCTLPPGKTGMVYLVGAGPGDPGLLTVKAAECLRKADTVLYDAMANPLLLETFCPETEQIDVSKRKDKRRKTQEEINNLLVQKAREGKTVVRLKGGDPLVFGRGGEEATVLKKAGISFEIVPGVSSVAAVPAYAGIPITDRRYASSYGVYSAHKKGGVGLSDNEWRCIAQGGPDTLIFLMGVTRCARIAEKLIEYGRPPTMPAAVVYAGTTPGQTRITGTLQTIGELTENNRQLGPGLIVVGNVVDAIADIDWFQQEEIS